MYMYKHVAVQKLNAESYAMPTEWSFDLIFKRFEAIIICMLVFKGYYYTTLVGINL